MCSVANSAAHRPGRLTGTPWRFPSLGGMKNGSLPLISLSGPEHTVCASGFNKESRLSDSQAYVHAHVIYSHVYLCSLTSESESESELDLLPSRFTPTWNFFWCEGAYSKHKNIQTQRSEERRVGKECRS